MTAVREPLGPPAHKPEDARRDVRRAWVSLALLPVAFALATLVGEGLLAVQGYGNAGVGTVPALAALWAGGPGLLVLMAPGAAALFLGCGHDDMAGPPA